MNEVLLAKMREKIGKRKTIGLRITTREENEVKRTTERTWEKNLVIKVDQGLSRLEWMWIVVDSSLATEAGKEY